MVFIIFVGWRVCFGIVDGRCLSLFFEVGVVGELMTDAC
jgi:hypothetical protein